MSVDVPHYTQGEDNTCALACLRMVLAAFGTHVSESELKAQARMVPRGTPIEELERLARRYGLVADIQQTTVEQLRLVLATGKLPVAVAVHSLGLSFPNEVAMLPPWQGCLRYQNRCGAQRRLSFRRPFWHSLRSTISASPSLKHASMILRTDSSSTPPTRPSPRLLIQSG
jgi:hypothetical protein